MQLFWQNFWQQTYPTADHESKDASSGNGFTAVAHALAKAGIRNIYGVIGIPVTELASAAQARV